MCLCALTISTFFSLHFDFIILNHFIKRVINVLMLLLLYIFFHAHICKMTKRRECNFPSTRRSHTQLFMNGLSFHFQNYEIFSNFIFMQLHLKLVNSSSLFFSYFIRVANIADYKEICWGKRLIDINWQSWASICNKSNACKMQFEFSFLLNIVRAIVSG